MSCSVHTLVFSIHCACTLVTDTSFDQHGVVLYFRFPLLWVDVTEDDQPHFALSNHLQSLLYLSNTLHFS